MNKKPRVIDVLNHVLEDHYPDEIVIITKHEGEITVFASGDLSYLPEAALKLGKYARDYLNERIITE